MSQDEEHATIVERKGDVTLHRIRQGYKTLWRVTRGSQQWQYETGYEGLNKFDRLTANIPQEATDRGSKDV